MGEKRVGIIGWPLGHTLSPLMHTTAFSSWGLFDWRYDSIPIPPLDFENMWNLLRTEYIGVNVTSPYKEKVMEYVEPDETARAVGAVNTVTFSDNSGTNTDVKGFMRDLQMCNIDVSGKRVVVIGAGGAARAAVYGLTQAGGEVAIVNRTVSKAYKMIEDLKINAVVQEFDEAYYWKPYMVVNCTPTGMYPNVEECPWPAELPIPSGAIAYDMIYRPAETVFLRRARMEKSKAFNGVGMLVLQGAETFSQWLGVPAPWDKMLNTVEEALDEEEKQLESQ